MRIGTKSVLYGAHCWFLHPWFVAEAWRRLYGFPLDPRLWACFWLHDMGYIGKPNLDGAEGERHVLAGAEIVSRLFDWKYRPFSDRSRDDDPASWWLLCLLHSRYWAKRRGQPPSRLCYADKLAMLLTPRWIYLPLVWLTGEWREYLAAHAHETGLAADTGLLDWYRATREYMTKWFNAHKNGEVDVWTKPKPKLRPKPMN